MKKKLITILMIICIVVAVGCGGYLAHYYIVSARSEGAVDQLREQIGKDITDDSVNPDNASDTQSSDMVEINGVKVQKKFATLYKENPDFMGWLTIADTHIDYPVMYTPSSKEGGEYYIHRNYEGDYSAAGLPFIDSNCQIEPATDNVIIYGHNMNAGTMFHDLLLYEDQDFYESHKTFTFDTIYGDGEYEVVACFRAQILSDDSDAFKYYEFVNAGSEDEFLTYVDEIKKMSIVDTGVDVQYGDKLVTLSTCAYHVTDGRFAVIAKKKEKR